MYFYSVTFNEVICGRVEGYDAEDNLKILQSTQDGYIRHIVDKVYVSKDKDYAEETKSLMEVQLQDEANVVYNTGNVVQLYVGTTVVTHNGVPLLYQIITTYPSKKKAKLVTSYGEEVGIYNYSDLRLVDEKPIFRHQDYSVGKKYEWVDGEDVYEGEVFSVSDNSVLMSNIKKLYPVDYKKRVPLYKIPVCQLSGEDRDINVLTTILDNRRQ